MCVIEHYSMYSVATLGVPELPMVPRARAGWAPCWQGVSVYGREVKNGIQCGRHNPR